jgi:predicted small metal-binding protein
MAAMRVLKCRDAGLDCDAQLTGQTDDEVMSQVPDHLRTAHGMEATPEMAAQARTLIHDQDPQESGTAPATS